MFSWPSVLWGSVGLGLLAIAASLHTPHHGTPSSVVTASVQNASSDVLPPLSDAMASTIRPERQGKMVFLQGKSDKIVGQLAKVPAENEQITEIKPLSNVDNHAGHELLSIISKY